MQAFRIHKGLSVASRALGARNATPQLAWVSTVPRSLTAVSDSPAYLHSSRVQSTLSVTRVPLSTSVVAQQRCCFSTGTPSVAARASRSSANTEDAPDIYSIDPDYLDENGMNREERAKIEKWAANFTKDQIPKGLLTINFVRASGPGGQNVNKGKGIETLLSSFNTKVDMRFAVDEALWLPPYVREQLKTKESNKINKNGELVMQSDAKRTQMANLDDCMSKLYDLIMETAQLPKLPDPESLARLERLKKAGDNRRKANKQYHSQKKSNRRVSRDD
ncbi:hypothetical protein BGW41_002324 [Actinomortierella wolfii]|nr:hypothetical protein BGW41_002324 [Actinomortierella wolfii]